MSRLSVKVFGQCGKNSDLLQYTDEEIKDHIAVLTRVIEYLKERQDCGIILVTLRGDLETFTRYYEDRKEYKKRMKRLAKIAKENQVAGLYNDRIPEQEYIYVDTIPVVTMELVNKHHTQDEVASLSKWMSGQTGLVLADGTCGIYAWDYERWLLEGMKPIQNLDTWD